jgi:hypothetical protein
MARDKEYWREWRAKNKDKVSAQNASYRLRHLDAERARNRDGRRQTLYGVTPAQYAAMLEAQGHKCACCGEAETERQGGRVVALAVDHSHSSGTVRSLLCQACNRTVGHGKESPARIRMAADYLERVNA